MTEGMKDLIQRVPDVYESRVRDVPMGRYGTPEEVAEVCLFLASDAVFLYEWQCPGGGWRFSDALIDHHFEEGIRRWETVIERSESQRSRQPPFFLNGSLLLEKAIRFVEEAGQKGVDLLAFPEGFIPAHPVWYHFHPATGKKSLAFATELFKNSVEIPGPTTEALCAAAAKANVNVVMGVCEKRPKTMGTMYNTQLFISRQGRILGKHQKAYANGG